MGRSALFLRGQQHRGLTRQDRKIPAERERITDRTIFRIDDPAALASEGREKFLPAVKSGALRELFPDIQCDRFFILVRTRFCPGDQQFSVCCRIDVSVFRGSYRSQNRLRQIFS